MYDQRRLMTDTDSDSHKQVGLSYSANLTAKVRLSVKRYSTGETVVRSVNAFEADRNEVTSRLPSQLGIERVQNGLSYRGKRRLRRAANFYQQIVDDGQTEKAYASFITLTYGKVFPADKTAKKDLANFIKRLKRNLDNPFEHYVWVAERQKRGAIHFHILTPHYVEKELVNSAWNGVVNGRFEKEEPSAVQQLYPNVIGAFHAGAYMAKYISKEGENIVGNGYFVSHKTSAELKPVYEDTFNLPVSRLDEVFDVLDSIGDTSPSVFEYDTEELRMRWFSDVPAHVFKELLEFHLSDAVVHIRVPHNFDIPS